MSMNKKATGTRHVGRSEMQRDSILKAASKLFIEKGFGGTSMLDIADSLGVTRPAIYYYFPNKESILESLTDEITRKAGNLTTNILDQSKQTKPEELLRKILIAHALLVLTHPMEFRVVERSESSLSEMGRTTAEAARKAVLANFVIVIQKGVDEGVFQVPNVYTAAFSILGMCNWTAWWFDGDDQQASQVAEQIAELALRTVVKNKQREFRSTSARESLQLLRDQIDLLERQLY